MSDSCHSDVDSGDEWSNSSSNGGSKKANHKKNAYQRTGFDEEEEEKLIELVKLYPCIYDVSSHDYKDRNLKNKSWNEIAGNLSKNVIVCKKKWKNIRDFYGRTKKSLPTGSGANPSQAKRLDLLSFLDSFSTINNK